MSVDVKVHGGVLAQLRATCAVCDRTDLYEGSFGLATPYGTTVLVADLPEGWKRCAQWGDGEVYQEAIVCGRHCRDRLSIEFSGKGEWGNAPRPDRYIWRGR